ncbi:MAG: translocation/assembly module TamB domain-containing protein [Treponema sp.]|nr:translocation/assembly module TamB domain-containing protein [Treponema sp.]
MVILTALRPIYVSVSRLVRSYEKEALVVLKDKTGLGVRYKSLSPSIFSGIHIQGIEVYDIESGELILTVRKASVKYSLSQLLHKNFKGAFTKVLINDVDFEFDKEKYTQVLEKLKALGKGGKEDKPEKKGFMDESLIGAIKMAVSFLPFDVHARNVRASYKSSGKEYTAAIRSLSLKRQKNGMSVETTLDGYAYAKFSNLMAGANFSINGNVLSSVDGSSMIVSIDGYRGSDYTVSKMEFLARYSNGLAVIRSSQGLKNYDLFASLNLYSGNLESNFSMKKLSPASVVRIPMGNKHISSFLNSEYTADLSFNCNLLTKKYDWSGSGSFVLPEGYLPTQEDIAFAVHGDNSTVYVDSVSASGKALGVRVKGSMELASLLPSADISLSHYTFPNGHSVSGNVYVRPSGKGISVSSPGVSFGEKTLSSVLVSLQPFAGGYSFSFSALDNSHLQDYSSPAKIGLTGNASFSGRKFLNTKLNVDGLFADTIVEYAAFFMKEQQSETIKSLAPKFASYMTNSEITFFTDFNSFSFASPSVLVRNPSREDQSVILEFEGNDRSLRISRMEAVYGGINMNATVDASISKARRQIEFASSMEVNKIPYNLSGVYSFDSWVNVTGDYGLEAMVDFSNDIFGSFQVQSFPVALSKFMLTLSTYMQFSYSSKAGLLVNIEELSLSETSGNLPVMPRISMTGQIDSKGAVLNTVSYTDDSSSLDGKGYFLWNINEGVFDSANLSINMANPVTLEKLSVDADLTNPLGGELSGDSLKKNCYFNSRVVIENFPLFRVIKGQGAEDLVTGTVTASGTIENPYVSLELARLSMHTGGNKLNASGTLAFVEGAFTIPGMSVDWGSISARNITASFDLAAFSGQMAVDLSLKAAGKKLFAPASITIEKLGEDEEGEDKPLIPSSISVKLDVDKMSGDLLKKYVPIHLELEKTPEHVSVKSDESLGLSAILHESGTLNVSVDEKKPLHFNLSGNIKGNYLNLVLTNLFCDIPKLAVFLDNSMLSVYSGVLNGQAVISGLSSDPNIDGSIVFSNLDFILPMFVDNHITAEQMLVTMVQNKIDVSDTIFRIKDGVMQLGVSVILDRLHLDSLDVAVATEKDGIPVNVKLPLVTLKGRTAVDTHILYGDNSFNLQGSVSLENSEITVMEDFGTLGLSTLTSKKDEGKNKDKEKEEAESEAESSGLAEKLKMNIDLNLFIGQKVNFLINPLVRGLVAPGTPIHFTMDTSTNQWAVEGDVALRGGEVFYFSRNFYLKEGRITLNETQAKFDPILTVRAETRERDDNGNSIMITLAAQNQPLSQFNPTFTASPAKSEKEIMEMLGQILTGDSSSMGTFAVTAGDFVTQTLILRKVEKGLRDLLNFDIFSIRTSLLQNAITQNMSSQSKNTTFGNYFDNTTVYIGKYFGNSVYVDGLLRWTYDENDVLFNDSEDGGLVFQPEFGLELMAPFANIRWQFAPEMGQLQESWVPATSVTLSWRFSF